MTIESVLQLEQQRAAQEAAARAAATLAKQEQYATLLYGLHDGEEMDPEDVLVELEATGRTAQKLNEDLELLTKRDAWQEQVDTLPQQTLQDLKATLDAAEIAWRAAEETWRDANRAHEAARGQWDREREAKNAAQAMLDQTEQGIPPRPIEG